VLAVDLPGHGLSDKPDGPYDYPAQVRRLSLLLDQETKGPIVLVGHSLGGQLAAGLALARPDRVRALVLIAPAGAGINPFLTDTGGIASPATQWVASALSFVLPARDSAWLREPGGGATAGSAGDSLTVQATRRVLEQFDFSAIGDSFRDIQQPVLLLWGRQDPTIPWSIGQRIAVLLPCRRFVTVSALHRPHQTLPDQVGAEMEAFLRAPGCG
jgi:2-hydroxy-6-oxo-6-(2'-carboxyphenyl)-hexa-2,4-dienoate hydrolase